MIGPEVRAPDVTEAVVGYRQFELCHHTQHNYCLKSPYQPEKWTSARKTARCIEHTRLHSEHVVLDGVRPKGHEAPHKDCGCGIYTYFDPELVSNDRYGNWGVMMGDAPAGPRICALMTLSGRVEVHARGMRAQHAEIKALGDNTTLSADERTALYGIAEAMGVRVVPQESLSALAAEHGSPLNESMRPSVPQPPTAPTKRQGLNIVRRPQVYVPGIFTVAINGVAALINVGVLAFLHGGIVSGLGIGVSSLFAGWFAGRRKEAQRANKMLSAV